MTPGKKTRATTAGEEARSALDPLERALLRHHAEGVSQVVEVRVDDGTYQDLPTSVFYRSAADRLDVDEAALACCRGRVLDVGACVGALALPLQEADHAVTALELLPGAVEVMRERGVRDARVGDLWTFAPERGYDTVLALMNGTAMAGTLTGLIPLLGALALPLAPDGQILVDSTDLRGRDGRGKARRRDGRYVGELQYQLEYEGERGAPFPQLFVDAERLAEAGLAAGLRTEIVWEGGRPAGAFLARLTRR